VIDTAMMWLCHATAEAAPAARSASR